MCNPDRNTLFPYIRPTSAFVLKKYVHLNKSKNGWFDDARRRKGTTDYPLLLSHSYGDGDWQSGFGANLNNESFNASHSVWTGLPVTTVGAVTWDEDKNASSANVKSPNFLELF